MEQTTSVTYPNLMILDMLLESSADAALLERAYELSEHCYQRLQTFRHADSGGFSLHCGGEPSAKYTSMGVVMLAHFARLFHGKGLVELQEGLDWLDGHEIEGRQAVFAALATGEAGVPWPGRAQVAEFQPANRYERALLANCLSYWQGPWPGSTPRELLLLDLIEDLQRGFGADDLIRSDGSGVMGSCDQQLHLETTALATAAFARAGHDDATRRGLEALSRSKDAWGSWGSTQSTALSIRAMALAMLARGYEAGATSVVGVTLDCGQGALLTGFTGGGVDRPLTLTRTLAAGPGDTVSLRLGIEADDPAEYGLGCTYRVATPSSAPRAPYRLTTSLGPPQVSIGDQVTLRVDVQRTGRPLGGGQILARIALPGGCRIEQDLTDLAGSARQELEGGFLTLYWEGPANVTGFQVDLRATLAGTFSSSPSLVYPYYESDREAYAESMRLKIIDGLDLETRAAIMRGAGR